MTTYINPSEVQKRLGLGRTGTYKLINNNGFPRVTIGKRILIPELEFEKYMKKHIGTKIHI